MRPTRVASALVIMGALFVFAPAQAQSRIDAAFQKFWAARSPVEAERVADDVVKTGVTFDEALRRLKAGRTYTDQKTGVIKLSNKTSDGFVHNFAVNVPPNYDPARLVRGPAAHERAARDRRNRRACRRRTVLRPAVFL